MTMEHNDYVCIKEKEIADLEAKAEYKEKRLNDIETKIEKMDEKLDKISENVNELIQQSRNDDKALELRLTKIETELKMQKQNNKNLMAYVGVALTVLTIVINVFFNIMK